MSGECDGCGAQMGLCYCGVPEFDFRAWLTSAVLVQQWREAIALHQPMMVNRETWVHGVPEVHDVRAIAALPCAADVVDELLGDT